MPPKVYIRTVGKETDEIRSKLVSRLLSVLTYHWQETKTDQNQPKESKRPSFCHDGKYIWVERRGRFGLTQKKYLLEMREIVLGSEPSITLFVYGQTVLDLIRIPIEKFAGEHSIHEVRITQDDEENWHFY